MISLEIGCDFLQHQPPEMLTGIQRFGFKFNYYTYNNLYDISESFPSLRSLE